MNRKVESFYEKKNGESDKNLTPGSGEKGKYVIQPVFSIKDKSFMLWWLVMTGRILQKSPEANSYNQNPHGYKQGLKTQPGSQEKNSGSNQNICQGGIAPQFSNNPGRGLFVKILE
ncbi:MAG: hypothetical protein ACE5D8_02730 [Fidelibacterota bacterium]